MNNQDILELINKLKPCSIIGSKIGLLKLRSVLDNNELQDVLFFEAPDVYDEWDDNVYVVPLKEKLLRFVFNG